MTMSNRALTNAGTEASVFDPRRLNWHIHTSHERALAVFDIVSHAISAGTTPVERTREAFTSAQRLQAAQILHNLKASVGNLGGWRVYAITCELEQLLAAQAATPMLIGRLDRLEQELVDFLTAADEWLRLSQGSTSSARSAQSPTVTATKTLKQ